MLYSSTEFAIRGNITKRTLRHYNKIGLLSPTEITENGYWYYDDSAFNRLQIILNLKILGLSLNEIKVNLENDFDSLRHLLQEKKRYVDEQIMKLQLARRLLENIEKKSDLTIVNALEESIEEEHIGWYERNISEEQYELVIHMMNSEDFQKEHERMVNYFKEFKVAYRKEDNIKMNQVVINVKKIFVPCKLEEETIKLLIKLFLKSNLEGPLFGRILTVKEVVRFLEIMEVLEQ